jgi:hypothetical protein
LMRRVVGIRGYVGLVLVGEPGGTRTRDHMIKSHVLYQLSYRPPPRLAW